MIVYHGSSHNFKTLRIRKDLTRQSSRDNEGYGIYFSLDKKIAKSYGKYVYSIEVNDAYLVDMRKPGACSRYLSRLATDLYKKFGVDMRQFMDVSMLVRYLVAGGVAIYSVGTEVANMLDSTEEFYIRYGRVADKIFSWLRAWNGAPKAYLFSYHIKDCGIIRDVSPEVARIVCKEVF